MAEDRTPEQQKVITDLLTEATKALKEQVELQAEVSRLNGEFITQAQQRAASFKEELRLQQELNEILSATSDRSVELVDTYKDQLFESQRVGRITLNNYNNQLRLLNEIETIQKERTRLANSDIEADQKKLKLLNERLSALKKEVTEQQRLTAAMNEGVRAGAGMVESLGNLIKLTPDLDQGIVGNLIRSVSETGKFNSAIDGAKFSLMEMFDAGNLFAFFIANTIELAVRMDNLTTSFVQATGASRSFNTEIVDTFDKVSVLGVGLEDSAEAFTDLFQEFTKFSTLGPQVRSQLAATAAGLEKLGVDSKSTGDSLDFLVTGLGMGVREAESILKRFAVEGRDAGIPPQVLAQQFGALEPKLAAFGRRAPDIFIRTAKTAKSLGIEVGELGSNLFSLSEGLDTFDQAADKAAAFNLVMGGSFVNAFDLTMAAAEGPFKQLEMLREGFDAAGRSFDNMNFFEQKMLADNFGISIGNLRAMMEGTLSPQEAMISQEEEFDNMVSQATSTVDKLSAAVEQLAAGFTFIGDFFNSAAGKFAAFAGGIGIAAISVSTFIKGFRALKATNESLNKIGDAMDGVKAVTNASTIANDLNTSSVLSQAGAYRSKLILDASGNPAIIERTRNTVASTIATDVNTVSEAANTEQKKLGVFASMKASMANMTLAGTLKMVGIAAMSALGAFGILAVIGSAFDLSGPTKTIVGLTVALIALGVALAAVRGAFGDFSGAAKGIAAGVAFGAGVYALMPDTVSPGGGGGPSAAPVNIGPVGQMGMGQFEAGQLQGAQAGDLGDVRGFRTGGDNITSSFIAGEGPSPRGEFVQPMSVIKAQESGNLANTLKETANALRDTRKSDGSFEKMLQALEKIAGNTEQQPEQRPIEVGLNIGGRQFQKEVVKAMNRELA